MKLRTLLPITIMAILLIGITISCNNNDDEPGISPTVTATNPITSATNVPTNQLIAITFGVDMESSSITEETFTLTNSTGAVSGSVSQTGTTFTFTPAEVLMAEVQYTASVSGDVEDLDGNTLGDDYSWSFTTGTDLDVLAPTVTASIPLSGAVDVMLNQWVQITFSESMNPASLTGAFTLKAGTVTVPGTATTTTTTTSTVVFIPSVNLEVNQEYTATVAASATDMAGNALAEDYTLTFTTGEALDTGLPSVTTFYPLDGAVDVAVDVVISVAFNEQIDPATIASIFSTGSLSFTVMNGDEEVPGTIALSDLVAVFTPTTVLDYATTYTVTVSTAVTDLAGNALAANVEWTFTTETECIPQNVDLKTAGDFGVLAGSAITNVGLSVINDLDVGISPGFRSSITGFPPGLVLNGSIYASDDIAPPGSLVTQAQQDLTDAYLYAQNLTSPAPVTITGDLGGRTLVPGIYNSASSMLLQSGDLILDGGQSPCDSSAIWVFQVGSAFTSVGGTGGNVVLIGGAKASQVFWQVGSSATIGDGTSFKGTVMALTSITMGVGSTMDGRLLARNGAVSLAGANTINEP